MSTETEAIHELYVKGRAAFDRSDFDEAQRTFEEIVHKRPHYAEVHNKLGLIHHQKGALGKAVDSFEKALAINPNYTEASLNLAVTYNELGQYDKAGGNFSRAAQIAPPGAATNQPDHQGQEEK